MTRGHPCLLACFGVLLATTAEAGPVRTVALSGTPAPGTDGLMFRSMSYGVINAQGEVAFQASLDIPEFNEFSNNAGIWLEDRLLAREHTPAVGVPGGEYSNMYWLAYNDAGQFIFPSMLTGPNIDPDKPYGLWVGDNDTISLLGREDSIVASFDIGNPRVSPVINAAGQAAFLTRTRGEVVEDEGPFIITSRVIDAIWSVVPDGTLTPITRQREPVPGMPGYTFGGVSYPRIADNGAIVFAGSVIGPNKIGGIWSYQNGQLALIVGSRDVAPGTGGANFYGLTPLPAINAAGRIAFYGVLDYRSEGVVEEENDQGIWSNASGQMELIARSGMHAPGTPEGVVFFNLDNLPLLGNRGDLLFIASLVGESVDATNNVGLWKHGPDGFVKIARSGDAAPGMGEGVTLTTQHNVWTEQLTNAPAINGAGQVAFAAYVTGQGVDNTNDQGLWASDLQGVLQLLLRTGDLFDVNDAPLLEDLRTIAYIDTMPYTGGGGDGLTTWLNDAGQIVINLGFTDGSSGVFVLSADVPEPASLALAVLALGVAGLRRKRVA